MVWVPVGLTLVVCGVGGQALPSCSPAKQDRQALQKMSEGSAVRLEDLISYEQAKLPTTGKNVAGREVRGPADFLR